MNRLFIELYLDEDVSALVASLLRARGYSVVTTRKAGRLGATEAEQLDYAVGLEPVILTHNRSHFEALAQSYFAAGRKHYEILIAVRRPPREIVRRLLLILNQTTADELENQVRYL